MPQQSHSRIAVKKMSDTDSDLAVSVYDPEDNLNFYGSPVERDDLSEPEEATADANAANENTDTERIQVSWNL